MITPADRKSKQESRGKERLLEGLQRGRRCESANGAKNVTAWANGPGIRRIWIYETLEARNSTSGAKSGSREQNPRTKPQAVT